MKENNDKGTLLGKFAHQINIERQQVVEEQFSIYLKPKPWWLPNWLYRKLISKLIYIEKEKIK